MAGRYYSLITALPSLDELGAAAPIATGELLERVAPEPGPRALCETLLLSDDLLQREAVLGGELSEAVPVVLTAEQVRDEAPLPEFLSDADGDRPLKVAGDALWAAYYRHADRVARQRQSPFLREWVRYEVGLRNALVAARAKALGLEASDYLVTPDLGGDEEDFAATVGEWSAAADPLAGLKALDVRRWNWVREHDVWFTFTQDELAAYAAKLMLLHRWQRLEAARADDHAVAAATDE